MNVDTILYICIGIILLLILQRYMLINEGFDDIDPLVARYTALRKNIITSLKPYCELTQIIQNQMKIIYTKANNETEEQANLHIAQTYRDVYACTDDLASSRPSCTNILLKIRFIESMDFIPCSTYLNLPKWTGSNQDDISENLSLIPNNLEYRINIELEWYSAILKKLQDALDMGNNPPSSIPDSPNSPESDPSGKPWGVDSTSENEGFQGFQRFQEFQGATCTPAAMHIRKALLKKRKQEQDDSKQRRLEAEAESCSMPSIDSEITRLNTIFQSNTFSILKSRCSELNKKAIKLQSDQEKLKNGTLYDWQKDPPKKTYKQFKGGDHVASLTFSMQQNK